jgi:hypothetical protein
MRPGCLPFVDDSVDRIALLLRSLWNARAQVIGTRLAIGSQKSRALEAPEERAAWIDMLDERELD